MVSQVLNVLPHAAVADIKRLLTSSALEQVVDEQKVERVISILLEGDAVPEDTEPPRNEEADSFQPPHVPEQTKPSAFAAARSNVFADRFDISKLHRGKQDLTKDEFLPSELRASIIAAAARQAQESDEEREEAEQDDVFADLAEGDEVNIIKVKDDVSEESGMEDDELAAGVSAVGTVNGRKEPSTPSLGATGIPKELESLYISTYTKDSSVFARENKNTPARAELKKRIAALKLPESVADEQIEGWARMLERNPKKEKILERFGMQQWRGNEKGIEVKPVSTSNSKGSGDGGGGGEASRGGRGGSSGRGRGRGRGRGQSDQRRRGHDKKMQKAGL
jgi:activating signal cointegrator complex subunit 2